MRIGVVSDIHNNIEALEYALAHLADADMVLNLGDLVSEYRVDPGIIAMARRNDLLGIVGNHEKTVLFHPGSSLRDRLDPDSLDYLKNMPASRVLDLAGRRVHVAHGAPWDDPDDTRCDYLYEQDRRNMDRLASLSADVLLLGHTHMPMLTRIGGLLVLNPGSCGEARGKLNRLSFAELDLAANTATIWGIRFGHPPEPLHHGRLAG